MKIALRYLFRFTMLFGLIFMTVEGFGGNLPIWITGFAFAILSLQELCRLVELFAANIIKKQPCYTGNVVDIKLAELEKKLRDFNDIDACHSVKSSDAVITDPNN